MNTLDISQKELLHILADVDKPVSIEYIQDRLGVSKRTVYSLISKVNESLFLAKIEPISNKRGQGYFLTKQQKESISKTFLNNISLQRLASNERMCYLICWIMYPKEPVHVKDIMELFDISRNSVFNDLKNLKSEIAKYDVELFFDIKGGYEIRGQIFSKRAVFLYYIKQLLQTISYKSLEFLEITETEEFYLRLQQISRDQGNEYDDFNLLSIACLLSVVHYLDEQFDFSVLELKNIEQTEELKLINELFQDLNMYERLYLTIHLLGSKASSVLRVEDDQRDIQLFELAEGLVNLFERNTSCNVSERNELVNSLYMHFKLSMYYFQFSIQITNSLLDDVKRNYGYLFQVIKRLCSLMENSFPFILSDSEISYITMHFGGHLKQVQGKTFGPVNVLVVCPSGISTSTLLKREIEDLYFNVKVVAVTSKANIIEYAEKIDFIISTIDLDTELPWIKVNTILTKEDKGRIASMMALSMQTYQINENNFEDFFAILKKYVEKDRMPGLKKEVYEFLRKGDLLIEVKENPALYLKDILQPEYVVRCERDINWDDAVRMASAPLIKSNVITAGYVEAMIKLVEDYGPYIVIKERIAIAHAKPEQGAQALGVSLLINREAIKFGDDINIHFLFVLSSTHSKEHLNILGDICMWASDDIDLNNLLDKQTDELLEYMNKIIANLKKRKI